MKISIEAHIEQEIEAVWWAWNDPDCIVRWNAASSDWHTTGSRVDLVVGGRFCHHMAAKDGSAGFDFTGTFTRVEAPTRLSFVMDDGREVDVQFASEPGGTWVQETFDAEGAELLLALPEAQRAPLQRLIADISRGRSELQLVEDRLSE